MRFLPGLLFFLSGATGLVYEVLWAKYLALTLGGTAAAQTAVLAVFLGGLAAGYAALGPAADRSPRPLRLYALLELAVAVLGALSPFAFTTTAGGLLCAAASSFLMGGTLPALVRAMAGTLADVERALAGLYWLNSIGAAAGALAAGFFLIPTCGLDGAAWSAAGLNALIAALAATLPLSSAQAKTRAAENFEPEMLTDVPLALLCAAALVSGAVSLSYEIAWIRLLCLVLGSSSYSFALMLAAFVCGIGAGARVVSSGRLPRLPADRLLGYAQLGAAAALLAAIPLYGRLPYAIAWIGTLFPRRPETFALFSAICFSLSFLLMLPTAAFLGACLPLAARAAVRRVDEAGGRIGLLFSFGTAGNVLGAVFVGLWLLPALGLRGLLTAGMLANLALAAAFLLRRPERRTPTAAVLASLALGAVFMPAWEPLAFSFGANRMEMPKGLDYPAFMRTVQRFKMLSIQDGREATIAVIQNPTSGISLMVNGKADASTRNDMRTQALLAHVPLILRPDAKSVVLIGLGSGVTAGAALRHPIEKLDVFELSPEVVAANKFFRPFNHEALDDPRLSLTVGDGRAELARSDRRYDVIISEPSNPWMAGVGNLFTEEFYRLARKRLSDGGLMLQWFHLYEMDDATLQLVLRTFAATFPSVSIWYTHSMDILLVGGETPATLDDMKQRFERPEVKEDMKRIGITQWTTFLSLQMTGPNGGRRWGESGPLNSDRRPRLEYAAPKAFFLRQAARMPFNNENRVTGIAEPLMGEELLLERQIRLRKKKILSAEYAEIAEYHEGRRGPFQELMVARWRAEFPKDSAARLAEAKRRMIEGELLYARKLLSEWLVIRPDDARARELAAGVETQILLQEARAAAEKGELTRAFQLARDAAVSSEKSKSGKPDEVWMAAASMAMKLGDSGAVLDALERALATNPDNEEALSLLDYLMKANTEN